MDDLRRAFDAKRAVWQVDVAGAVPEEVLVFEAVGSIDDFQLAVQRISGLEWLAEWEDELLPDDDFYKDEEHRDKPLGATLFLTMTNQAALQGIERLWRQYKESEGKSLPHNLGRWRSLFDHLKEVRFWSTEDRLRNTGLREKIDFELSLSNQTMRIEAELWFHRGAVQRAAHASRVRDRIATDGGQVLTESVIEEIAYHALLFELPTSAAKGLLDGSYDPLVARDSAVMFLRPVGQTAVPVPTDEPLDSSALRADEISAAPEPVVALLDGLPLENHEWLRGGLILDDPDGWSADYPAMVRAHGTAMASLILRGDITSGENPLIRQLYVRPVMRPKQRFDGTFEESIPDDSLPLDLIHRVFKRMFEGDAAEGPVAPTVRIVNFSLGDEARQFDRAISSWGRLFDWLSWHYNVLILVSAGNYAQDVELDLPTAELSSVSPEELERSMVRAVASGATRRRLLVPGEAINVLTVAATHFDNSTIGELGPRIDCYQTAGLPSPLNRIGLGYRRAIKPDILMPGGRQLYQLRPTSTGMTPVLQIAKAETQAPGILVAAPGPRAGDLAGTLYKRGTSNATALASRTAARLLDTVAELHNGPGGDALRDICLPAILKALLVHGSSWSEGHEALTTVFLNGTDSGKLREYAARFIGYGHLDPTRVLACTDQRATVVGCGVFTSEGAHQFSLPLPSLLSGRRDWRRLAITLAWLTPINPARQTYRRAVLSFGPTAELIRTKLGVNGRDVDARAVKRGTVQHQVFEGQAARLFDEGDVLTIQVDCREEAGKLDGRPVPYSLVVTLEVAEELGVPLYEEIFLRIRPPVRVSPVG